MSGSTVPGPSHRNVANIRPSPSTVAGSNSPHTPQRAIPTNFGSPSSLRAEEDCIIIEIGARHLRVGFAGDAVPKAVVGFGPDEQRRAGDYTKWQMEYEKSKRGYVVQKSWGESHELWRPDLRGLDLGLVGDKIDRAMREAYTKHLLIDSRPRRMVLSLPAALPIPLLSITLDTLFASFQPPNISLMPAPVLVTVAAGLRSALVIDIGWAETVVTAVYEYRQVQCKRSTRGMKMLGEAFFKMVAEGLGKGDLLADSGKAKFQKDLDGLPNFEECEDILERMAWCKPGEKDTQIGQLQGLTPVKEEDEFRASMRSLNLGNTNEAGSIISIPLTSTNSSTTLRIPFSNLAEPCESALFAAGTDVYIMDDEELPLDTLIYRSLLQLPVDVRSICMSRIIFVGGGSNIPGLKGRALNDLANLIDKKGWDSVHGKAYDDYMHNQKASRTRKHPTGPQDVSQSNAAATPTIPAAFLDQESDPIDNQLRRESNKRNRPIESGNIRAVNSLGAWSGGSLLSQLKIPAVSVVDREQWQQHGASGASKSGEVSAGPRQSIGPTAFKSGATDRNSWTLGLWG